MIARARRAIQLGSMRLLIVLSFAWAAAAQVEKPAERAAEIPPLVNTGKPMTVEYVCGEEDIRSAGLSCTLDEPCPLFLELASVEAVGNRIFAAGNIHSSSTTLSSVLLASDDTGKTWREPHTRIPLAGLDRIQFIDFETGWISGEMQHPLPHDPFFLVTKDGGKTWQEHSIFGEPQFGSILQFAFSSRANGSLVIDRGSTGESGRYQLFETTNAGESWTLRQGNERPIEIKRASGGVDADWRLRADAASKSYRIERRAGGGWHGIAAFSVSIGVCTPPEIPAAPAPPVQEAPIPPQRSEPPGR
jgi:hypothetical protein